MAPAIRILALDDARIALAVAAALARPVTLVSAPGAAAFGGPAWWRHVIDAACAEHPDAAAEGVLDCGTSAGDALASLRAGVRGIRFAGRPDVAARLRAIAAAQGARVVASLPPALELAGLRDPRRACEVWLRDDPAPVEARGRG